MNLASASKVGLLCGLLLLIGACSRKDSTGNNGTLPMNPNRASTNPRGELTKSMSAMLAAKSYRVHWTTSSDNGNSTMDMEFVAPDRYHILREGDVRGRTLKNETIIVGSDTYMKMGEGTWQKFPMNMNALIAQFRDPKVIEEISKSTDVKFIGPDTVNGIPAMVYQYTFSDSQGKGFRTSATTWIAVTNNLPVKTESEGEVEIMGKNVKSKSTIVYSGFEEPITIERPM